MRGRENYYRHRETFDADRLAPKLYQGSAPPPGPELRARGFDVLVLAAEEIQPPSWAFPGVQVIHAPSDDGEIIPERSAHAAAQEVARALKQGKRALVTCAMGLNRSGIISALALWYATGRPGHECVALVQRKRRSALCNHWFVEYLSALPARDKRQPIPGRRDARYGVGGSLHV
jgi:hypothetical protein